MRWLVERKIAALALTFRAHGDSSGDTNDVGSSARADVIAGVEFIERNAPSARIVVIGRSLGAAASIYAARDLGSRVSAYVLESPYRDLATAVRHRLRMHLFAPCDEIALLGMRLWSHAWLVVDLDACRPIDRVRDIPSDAAIVFLSGARDRHAPFAEVEEIAAHASSPAEVVRFEGAEHVSLYAYDHERYEAVLERVFARVEANAGR
jgi:alpha-beta hydrolase superfamily lysophospholipase